MSIARPALAAIAALGTSLALACLAAPWILTLAGIDPTETDLLNRLAGPSAAISWHGCSTAGACRSSSG